MFRFSLLCKNLLLPTRNNGSSALPGADHRIQSPLTLPIPHFHFLLQNPIARTISNASAKDHSLTISYLIGSCGLSPESAVSAATKVHLKTTEKPDAVLKLLHYYGLSKTDITTAISKFPKLLSIHPSKTLKPKLEFFHSAGFVGPQFADIISTNPYIFRQSLEKSITPSVNFLKSVLVDRMRTIAKILKHSGCFVRNGRIPNIEILQNHGVPNNVISKTLVLLPQVFLVREDRFYQVFKKALEIGCNPKSTLFASALMSMFNLSESKQEEKFVLFSRLGWSKDEALTAFKSQPHILRLSEKAIEEKKDLFLNKIGWSPAILSRNPVLLQYSLQKRLIPRFAVLSLLMSKGVIETKTFRAYNFQISEKNFSDKFVSKYKDTIPQVVDAYQDKMGFA